MTDLCYNCCRSHFPQPCTKKLQYCEICHQLGHTWNFCHLGALVKQDYRYYFICHNCDSWHLPSPCQNAPIHCSGCGEKGHLRYYCPVRPIQHTHFPEKVRSVISKYTPEEVQSTLHNPVFAEALQAIKMSAVNDALFLVGNGYPVVDIRNHLHGLYAGHITPQPHYADLNAPPPANYRNDRPMAQHNNMPRQYQPDQMQHQGTNSQYHHSTAQHNGANPQLDNPVVQHAHAQCTQARQEPTDTQHLDPHLERQASNHTEEHPVDSASRAMIDAAIREERLARTPDNVQGHQSTRGPEAPTPSYEQSYDDEPVQPATQGPFYDTFPDSLSAYSTSSVNGNRAENGGMENGGQNGFGLTSPGETPTSDAIDTQDGEESFTGNGHASA